MMCLDFTLVANLLLQLVAKNDETCNTTHMNILVLGHQLSSPSIGDTPSPTGATTWKSLFTSNFRKAFSRKHQEELLFGCFIGRSKNYSSIYIKLDAQNCVLSFLPLALAGHEHLQWAHVYVQCQSPTWVQSCIWNNGMHYHCFPNVDDYNEYAAYKTIEKINDAFTKSTYSQ